MSVREKYLAGWTFRTKTPDFEVGEEIRVIVNEQEDSVAKARIGDSMLRITEAPKNLVNKYVKVEIDEWDTDSHSGEGTYLETVGESSF